MSSRWASSAGCSSKASSRSANQKRPSRRARPEQAEARPGTVPGGDLLRRGLDRSGLHLTATQHETFDVYLSELRRWATQMNLTGLRTAEAIVREGFLRSLAHRAAFEPAPPLHAIDVGSGAGFPGLVLKIGYPDIDMVLLEPRRKRAAFLRFLVRRLGLVGIRCIQARAEALSEDNEHRGRYDLAFARAVGPIPEVARLVKPLLKPGGRLILQVGQEARASLRSMEPAFAVLEMSVALREGPAPDAGHPPTHLLVLQKA